MTADELPEGWSITTVGELARVSSGKYIKRTEYVDTPTRPHPVAGAAGVIGWCDQFNTPPPILTLGRVGSAGALNIYQSACWVTDNALIVQPIQLEWLSWLGYFFRGVSWSDISTGSSQPLVTQTQVKSMELPLPPLAEQRRIVAAVERILDKVSAARARLDRVPTTMKRFRQAVLAAACSGRLTADWRESDISFHQPHDEMPEIPCSWEYKASAEIVEPGTVISYGIVLPGPNLDKGVPYVRGQDITDSGAVLVDQLWRTSQEVAEKHKRSVLAEGDVLLCVIRHLRVAVVPKGLDGANLTQGTVRLRPSKFIDRSFLAYFLQSPQSQAWMKARYIGMSMPRINVEHARQIPVPLPPLAEQHEIVRRVSALFARADAIEARATAARKRVDALTQAVLAKAFRGELVPTEADLARRENRPYEPAANLLARVRSAAVAPAKPKRGRKSVR